jgi:hypothetical protein
MRKTSVIEILSLRILLLLMEFVSLETLAGANMFKMKKFSFVAHLAMLPLKFRMLSHILSKLTAGHLES